MKRPYEEGRAFDVSLLKPFGVEDETDSVDLIIDIGENPVWVPQSEMYRTSGSTTNSLESHESSEVNTLLEDAILEQNESERIDTHPLDSDDDLSPEEIWGLLKEGDTESKDVCSAPLREISHRNSYSDYGGAVEEIFYALCNNGYWCVDGQTLWACDRETCIWRAVYTPADMAAVAARLAGIHCLGDQAKLLLGRFLTHFGLRHRFTTCQSWAVVSFADGLYNVRTDELRECTPHDRVIYALDMDYAEVECARKSTHFRRLVREAAGDEAAMNRLQELCGVALNAAPARALLYILAPNLRVSAAFVNMIDAVVDPVFVSHVSLSAHKRGFATAQVAGKHLVLSTMEGEAFVQDLESVLRILNGDGLNADRKFQDPLDFKASVTMVCAGRQMPTVQYNHVNSVSDFIVRVTLKGDLSHREIAEMYSMREAFVFWAIEGLRRYLEQGTFTACAEDDAEDEFTSLRDFVEECIELDPNASCASSVIIDAYADFCRENCRTFCADTDLHRYLRRVLGHGTSSVRVRDESGTSRVLSGYRGIRLRGHCGNQEEETADIGVNDGLLEVSPSDIYEDATENFEDRLYEPGSLSSFVEFANDDE